MSKKISPDGITVYKNNNGEFHREDGPAIIHSNGSEQWFIKGLLHREGGPAIRHPNGEECWYINGKLHREDGPAITYTNGVEYWYRNGENITRLVKDHVHNWKSWSDKEKLVFKLKFL